MRFTPAKFAWLAVLCFAISSSYAQTVQPKIGEAIVVDRKPDKSKIRIDGLLNEPVWKTLPVYDDFRVIEPDTLARVRYKTRVRFMYNMDGLYVGVDMEEPKSQLSKRLTGRDKRVNRDTIGITLDTSGEGRYGYWFAIALGNSLMDGTVLPERRFSNEWDGAWRGASHVTDHGWSAEFFIPWGTVAMPAATGSTRRIGMYMSRKVAALDERWGWPALPSTQAKFLSVLQPLEFTGVNPRQQYSLFPFVSVSRDRIANRTKYRSGLDVFWRPSSNFQLLGTINPDFGNVESDNVVINLSSIETFFPEKRLFFLEGQGVFNASPRARQDREGIGPKGAPITLVNTRRIGGAPRSVTLPPGVTLSERETTQPVPLKGAIKTTGQVGRLRYGFLGAAEEDIVLNGDLNGALYPIHQEGSKYAVGRLLYEDSPNGGYRALGVLSTAVTNPVQDAMTDGVDGHYLTPNGKWKLDGQAFTSAKGGVPRGYGGFMDVVYTIRQGVAQRFGVSYFDRNVDINDLGYLARNDNMRIRTAHIRTNSNIKWARQNQFDLRGFVQQNTEHYLTGAGMFLTDKITFHNLTSVRAYLNFFPSSYDDINSEGNGTFRKHSKFETGLDWSSDTAKRFTYGVGYYYGQEDLGDDHFGAGADFTWRPSDQYTLTAHASYDNMHGWLLHDTGRDFTSFNAEQWFVYLSLDYFITAKQQLRGVLQWVGVQAWQQRFFQTPLTPGDLIEVQPAPGRDDSFGLGQLSFQLRYRWEIAPLSDLFVVYTRLADHNQTLQQDSFRTIFTNSWQDPLQDVLVVKLRFRFGS